MKHWNRRFRAVCMILVVCFLSGCMSQQTIIPPSLSQSPASISAEPAVITPTKEPENPVDGITDEELLHAYEYGFVPGELWPDLESAITYAQFCTMLKDVIILYDESRVGDWEARAKLALASKKEMDRENGMLAIFVAADVLGLTKPNNVSLLQQTQGSLGDDIWQEYDLSFPLFPNAWDSYEWQGQDNGLWFAAMLYSWGRVSKLSGKALFDYDEAENTVHPREPLAIGDAIRALARFYESGKDAPENTYRSVDAKLLPDRTGTDFALFAYTYPNRATQGYAKTEFVVNFMSAGGYPVGDEVNLTCDILLQKSLVDGLGEKRIQIQSSLSAFDMRSKEIAATPGNQVSSISCTGGNASWQDEAGNTARAKNEGEYYRFRVSALFSFESGFQAENITPTIRLNIPSGNYEGAVYLDNTTLKSDGKTIVSYGFEGPFGVQGKENIRTYVRCDLYANWAVWQPLSEGNKSGDWNVIRSSIVFDGNPIENNLERYMAGIDPDELHNPGHDWRNWYGTAVHFSDQFGVSKELSGSIDVIIPNETLDGYMDESSYIELMCDMDLRSKPDTTDANVIFCRGKLMKDDTGKPVFVSESGSVVFTEYQDCWVLTLSGACPVSSGVESEGSGAQIWTGLAIWASGVAYKGYWYFDNVQINADGQPIVNYDIDSDPLPENLTDFYNHNTNGGYYYWNDWQKCGIGFEHFGFDTVAD